MKKEAKKKRRKPAKAQKPDYFVHPTAMVEDRVEIGSGTKIWHYAQIRHDTKIGQNCIIANTVFIDFDSEIGDNVKIQNHAIVYHKAIIGDGVFIGPNVCFTNDNNPRAINPDGSIKGADDWEVSTIKIGKGAAIGAHSVITPGITIGQFAMAGSGSVISRDVPDFALVFGNPARIRGFVCKCGGRIFDFEKRTDNVIGHCKCGIDVKIALTAYKAFKEMQPKRKLWIR